MSSFLTIITIAYLVLQIIMLHVPLSSHYSDEMWKHTEREDDKGFVKLKITDSIWEWIVMPIPMLVYLYKKNGYIRYRAKEDAKSKKYNNNFSKSSHQKKYDKVYLNKRKELLLKLVSEDIAENAITQSFLNDAEKAFYQSEYLNKTVGKEAVEKELQKRAQNVYDQINAEPVDSEVFVEIMRKTM